MTLEQGKPMKEALGEVLDLYHPLMSVGACDFEVLLGPDWLLLLCQVNYGASFIEYSAEEAKRIYGDIIPPTLSDRRLLVLKQALC